jgi:hypothetical protein
MSPRGGSQVFNSFYEADVQPAALSWNHLLKSASGRKHRPAGIPPTSLPAGASLVSAGNFHARDYRLMRISYLLIRISYLRPMRWAGRATYALHRGAVAGKAGRAGLTAGYRGTRGIRSDAVVHGTAQCRAVRAGGRRRSHRQHLPQPFQRRTDDSVDPAGGSFAAPRPGLLVRPPPAPRASSWLAPLPRLRTPFSDVRARRCSRAVTPLQSSRNTAPQ